MRFQKLKTDFLCVGRRHTSATRYIYGDITSKSSKVLIGYCSICNRKKSMTVSDNTIQAEGLDGFINNLGKKGFIVSRKMAKDILKNPGRALEIGANFVSAFATKSPKASL